MSVHVDDYTIATNNRQYYQDCSETENGCARQRYALPVSVRADPTETGTEYISPTVEPETVLRQTR